MCGSTTSRPASPTTTSRRSSRRGRTASSCRNRPAAPTCSTSRPSCASPRSRTACPTAASGSSRSSPRPASPRSRPRPIRTASPRLAGLTWGAEDLSAAIGARAARDEHGRYTDVFRYARAVTLLAASAADVPAIDTVFVDFRDLDGLRAECLEAERDGFTAKLAIHPAQVPVINEVFTPSAEAVAHARRWSPPSPPPAILVSSASTARCTTSRT